MKTTTATKVKKSVSTPASNGIPKENLGEYNGKPMLILNPGARFAVQFGPAKAREIVKNIELVKKFAAMHPEKTKEEKE